MQPLRILIGGSHYGRAYLEALALDAARYRPAVLLARGSQRSRGLAQAHGIPWVPSLDAAPRDFDLACLALPPAPPEALALLRAGIPVLCEHPQPPDFVEAALAAGGLFHLNGHFSRLPASAAFTAHARLRQQQAVPVFATIAATDRSLYAAIDILAGALGPPVVAAAHHVRRGPLFTSADVEWGGCTASFQIQNRGPADGSREYRLDYRLALGFPDGILTLLSIAGPVVWNANYARFGAGGQSLWSTVHAGTGSAADLRRQRALANLAAVDGLRACAEGAAAPGNQTAPYLLGVARLWQTLGALLAS